MSRKIINQATLLILDIGRNVSEPEEKGGKSFFEHAKDCTSRVIERKIISQGSNLLGLILIGSKQSKDDFKHIEVSVNLQTPTWKMIHDLPQTTTKYTGNWFDSLLVAGNHFENEISGFNILNKKIILLTNFQKSSHLQVADLKKALNGFKDQKYEVDVIGPDLYAEDANDDIQIAKQLVETTNGSTATFEYTMRYLMFHRKKVVKAVPWNVDLSIGPNIKIPVSAYLRIVDEPVVKKWGKLVKDPETNTPSTSEGVLKYKTYVNTENQEEVNASEVIKGYQYGGEVIPFSECDKSLLYDSGLKSLLVYGFTDSKNITWQNLNGDKLSYVFGRKGDEKAKKALRCLVECLHELNLVAIVRRVYNNGNAPKMMALMPVIDTNNYMCLSMAEICYKDDIKNMLFPPTNEKKYDYTEEQVNGFKDLIKSMDLMKAYNETEYDDTEAFPIGEMVSPSAQYVLDCIAFRALNPESPLPQPRDDILMLFKIPPLIEKISREPLQKLKNLFVLNEVDFKKKGKKRKQSLSDEPTLPVDNKCGYMTFDDSHTIRNIASAKKFLENSNDIKIVGTTDPINDYIILKKGGKSLDELIKEMIKAIEDLTYGNIDGNFSKPFSALAFLRNECIEAAPLTYNNWLKMLKSELHCRKKDDVIKMITEKSLDYILESENSLSTYKECNMENDSYLYENDTEPEFTPLRICSEINDLIDNA